MQSVIPYNNPSDEQKRHVQVKSWSCDAVLRLRGGEGKEGAKQKQKATLAVLLGSRKMPLKQAAMTCSPHPQLSL